MVHLRRSILYVPANKPRALDKARALPLDGVIIDLEDAVAPDGKTAAREAIAGIGAVGPETALRVNGADTPWHDDDVKAARQAGITILVLPKVATASAVTQLAQASGACIWPMIETPEAILEARAIAEAAAATGPAALVLGTNDLAAALGVDPGPDRAVIATALQHTVIAARAHRIDVLDGVFNTVHDADGLAREAQAGAAMGMTGKTVIHPAQIDPVNRAFSPDATSVAKARRIVEAMRDAERTGRAVATLDGRLIEALHARAAEALLEKAAAIAARGSA